VCAGVAARLAPWSPAAGRDTARGNGGNLHRKGSLGRAISRRKSPAPWFSGQNQDHQLAPAGCGYRADVHSWPGSARYVSRSRAGAADASVR